MERTIVLYDYADVCGKFCDCSYVDLLVASIKRRAIYREF